MGKIIILPVLLCLITAACRSAESLPEFSAPIEIVDNRPFVAIKIKDKLLHFVIGTGGFHRVNFDAGELLCLTVRAR